MDWALVQVTIKKNFLGQIVLKWQGCYAYFKQCFSTSRFANGQAVHKRISGRYHNGFESFEKKYIHPLILLTVRILGD